MKLITLILLLVLVGCGTGASSNESGKPYIKVTVVEYDECEYLEAVCSLPGLDNFSYILTHKGNCRYCYERSVKERSRK